MFSPFSPLLCSFLIPDLLSLDLFIFFLLFFFFLRQARDQAGYSGNGEQEWNSPGQVSVYNGTLIIKSNPDTVSLSLYTLLSPSLLTSHKCCCMFDHKLDPFRVQVCFWISGYIRQVECNIWQVCLFTLSFSLFHFSCNNYNKYTKTILDFKSHVLLSDMRSMLNFLLEKVVPIISTFFFNNDFYLFYYIIILIYSILLC